MIRQMLSRLARDNRGAAIIELALVAPILATMTVGVIDLSNGFSRKLVLEQAAQRSIEKVMQTTGVKTVQDTIKDEAAEAAGISRDNVTVTYTLTCAGVAADPTTECANNNTEVRYTEVTLWDTYTPMIPMRLAGMQSNGTFRLTATTGIRTQ